MLTDLYSHQNDSSHVLCIVLHSSVLLADVLVHFDTVVNSSANSRSTAICVVNASQFSSFLFPISCLYQFCSCLLFLL